MGEVSGGVDGKSVGWRKSAWEERGKVGVRGFSLDTCSLFISLSSYFFIFIYRKS